MIMRRAADMEKLAALVRLCGNEPAFAERVELAGVGGEIWGRARDELTHNRVAALVAEVIAARLQDELWRKIDTGLTDAGDHVAARDGLNDARAATDKAFGE